MLDRPQEVILTDSQRFRLAVSYSTGHNQGVQTRAHIPGAPICRQSEGLSVAQRHKRVKGVRDSKPPERLQQQPHASTIFVGNQRSPLARRQGRLNRIHHCTNGY